MKWGLIVVITTLTMALASAGYKQIIVCTDNDGCQIVTVFTDD